VISDILRDICDQKLKTCFGDRAFSVAGRGVGTTFQHPYALNLPWTRSSSDSSHIISRGRISDVCRLCHGLCQGANSVTVCAVLWRRRNCQSIFVYSWTEM